jgi:hypothetical protein
VSDDLNAFRGIVIAVLIMTVFWAIVATVAWAVIR